MVKQLIAIYPGRFQPFGKHHAATFLWITETFGSGNSYIVTSDKVESSKSPFNFTEKKAIIDVFGFGDKVIKVKSPYNAKEIINKYDPEKIAVVYAVGKKDAERLTNSKYFEELPKNYKLEDLKPSTEKGYYTIAPHFSITLPGEGEMSGTSIRSALSKVTSKNIESTFNNIFGWYAPKMANYIVNKIKGKTVFEETFNIFSKDSWKGYFDRVLNEGGVGGHMAHPFDFTNTGSDLIKAFEDSIKSIEKGSSSVKIDGVNSSIRLTDIEGKKQFVLDRGSASDLDIKGVTKSDLPSRFPSKGETEHGFVKIGGKVLDIFNDSLSSTQSELKKLGLLDNPNILLNIEYVEGKSNVIGYENIGNFLAIHGLKEVKPKNIDSKTGKVKSRQTSEISYNDKVMKDYINKLDKIASKYGFKVLGSVDTKFKSKPNLNKVLSEKITLYPEGEPVSKSLGEWLKPIKFETPLITRANFVKAINSKNITQDFPNIDSNKVITDTIVYIATVKLGDEILKNADSEIGSLDTQEGIVVRDNSIYSGGPFKITGQFITKGMESSFQK